MRARTIAKGVLSVGAWNFARIATSALISPILSRLLGVEGYGQYAVYLGVIYLASPFANLGTSYSLTKAIAEGPPDGHWQRKIAALAALVNLVGLLLAGSGVVLYIAYHSVPGVSPIVLAFVVAGALAFDQAFCFSRGVLYGLRREELAGIPGAAGSILGPLVGVALVVLGYGVLGVLLGLCAGNIFVAVITLGFVWSATRTREDTPPLRAPSVQATAFLRFGLSTMLFSALSMALYKADIVIVRALSPDPDQAGLYAAAVQLSEFVWVIPLAVEGVMLQSTARLWADKQEAEITSLVSRLVRYTALACALPLLIMCVFVTPILSLYFGPAYVRADAAVRILIPGVFSFSLARVIWPVIQARGNVSTLVAVVGGAAAANIVLCLLLIPRWGAIGAAIATTISYGAVVFVYALRLSRWGVHAFQGFRGGALAFVAVLTFALMGALAYVIRIPLLELVIGGAVGTLCFALAVFRLNLLCVQEVENLVDSLPGILRRPGQWFVALCPRRHDAHVN